jgi:hypothetical protein
MIRITFLRWILGVNFGKISEMLAFAFVSAKRSVSGESPQRVHDRHVWEHKKRNIKIDDADPGKSGCHDDIRTHFMNQSKDVTVE